MFPLRDDRPAEGTPVATLLLIAACTVPFAATLVGGPALEASLARAALVPAEQAELFERVLARLPDLRLRELYDLAAPYVSSLFLHGGALHLIGNMWFLFVFGRSVEARLGHVGFAAFYLACGVIAGVLHTMSVLGEVVVASDHPWFGPRYAPLDRLPTVGASGAIAGVLGAYFVLFPRARIVTFIPPLFLFAIPAVLFLAIWFAGQYLAAEAGVFVGVAHWAHVGGFVAGMGLAVLAMAFDPRRFGLERPGRMR